MRVILGFILWFVPYFGKKTVVVLNDYGDYIEFEALDRRNPQRGPYATVEGLFWLGDIFFMSLYDHRETI